MEPLMLVRPSLDYAAEIRSYRAESLAEAELINGSGQLQDYEDPADWIARCRLMADPATADEDWVDSDEWLTVDAEHHVVGLVNIRRSLKTADIAEYAGHLGYSIRPSLRRRGYATAQLLLALGKCHGLGIDRVLVTCEPGNEGSRRTILACGGVFERTTTLPREYGQAVVLERYWIG